jgi:hypothetical protein
LQAKRKELEEQQKGMKKKINPKVLNMIDTCVPDLATLMYLEGVLRKF